MTKRNKIIYWIATIWLALGMVATGAVQLLKAKEGQGGADMIAHLSYPVYLLTFLGICKILGVVALLIPKFPLLKEWAYAGFAIDFIAAFVSITIIDGVKLITLFPLVALIILITSYWSYYKIIKSI